MITIGKKARKQMGDGSLSRYAIRKMKRKGKPDGISAYQRRRLRRGW